MILCISLAISERDRPPFECSETASGEKTRSQLCSRLTFLERHFDMRRLESAEVGLERLRVLDVDGEARGEERVEGVEAYEADAGRRLGGGHHD